MTIDSSKIDEIFHNGLKDYEVAPPYEVWEDIVVHVAERRRRRKRRIYLQIAASLIVLIVAGSLFLTQSDFLIDSDSPTRSIAENQSFSNMVEEPPSQSPPANAIEEKSPAPESSGSAPVVVSKAQNPEEEFEMNTGSIASLSVEDERSTEFLKEKTPMISGIASNSDVSEDLVTSEPETYTINTSNNDNFVPAENVAVASDLPKTTHFSLKATMAPVMSYRRLQNNASRLEYNTSESELFSYSGGVNFGYKLNKRWSVHSGFYYSQIGQTVNKIRLGSDDFAQYGDETFIRLNNSLGEVEVEPTKLLSAKPPENIQNIVNGNRLLKFSYKLDASVVQRFEYVKIPLMLEYTMIDKKIDVNLVGGLNSNFLVNEGVYLKNQTGNSRLIGNTTNIRQFNYSGALGLGFEYNLTRQINMYFEPHMDYFLNPINYSETKTYPYSFAVHTGLSVTF